MINRCIDMGVVLTRWEIEHIQSLGLDWVTQEKAIRIMENESFSELIELIHEHDFWWSMSDDQRLWDRGHQEEKRIKSMLRDYLWEDVELCIKEDWRKDELKKLF